MAPPIVEAARERLVGRPLAGLLDDAVITLFELYPAEQKTLAGILLAEGKLLEAEKLSGCSQASFTQSVENLAKRGLLSVKSGLVDLTPMQARLKVETAAEAQDTVESIPEPRVVLQSVPATAMALARTSSNPGIALGRVYAFLYGQRPKQYEYAVLAKIAGALGGKRAVRFLLEHMLDDFQGKEPLRALLPLAIYLGQEHRPEGAPSVEEQNKEKWAEARAGWELRMHRWMEDGGELHALACIDQAEADGYYGKLQADMLRRQVKLDFERYRDEGEPRL